MRVRVGLFLGVLGALSVLGGGLGFAKEFDGFNTQNYRVPTDPNGYITMNGARTLKKLQPHISVGFNWAHNPLTFVQSSRDLIKDITYLDLAAGLGLIEIGDAGGIEVGVYVPLTVDLHGNRLENMNRRLPDGGFGDIQANVKATLFDREEDLIGLFGRMYIEFPSGNEDDFTSNKDKYTLGWQVGVEKQLGKLLRVGVELGYEWVDGNIQVGGVTIDDKFRLNGGAMLNVGEALDLGFEDLWVVFEVQSYGRPQNLYDRARESPVELGGGLKYTGTIYAQVGATAGVNRGVGAPDVRIYFSLGFTGWND